MLVTADDLVLNYIYQGSIDLQDMAFSIQDKDSVPSGIIALLSFGVSSDGEVTPPKNGAQELFKTADCTGQAYVSAYADQVAIFGGGDVEGLRSPIVGIESTEENVVFESTQFNGIITRHLSNTLHNPAQCCCDNMARNPQQWLFCHFLRSVLAGTLRHFAPYSGSGCGVACTKNKHDGDDL